MRPTYNNQKDNVILRPTYNNQKDNVILRPRQAAGSLAARVVQRPRAGEGEVINEGGG